MQKTLLKVKKNELIADRIFQMDLEGDFSSYKPGQFLHIKCTNQIDPLLRRPISICDIDDKKKTLSIIYRTEGKGTTLLAQTASDQEVDVLGPLGAEFPHEHLKTGQTVLMVGGGIGVPPLYYLARKLKARGVNIKAIIGFNSAKDVFLEKEFKALGETYVSTIDGSGGHKGLVTDLFDIDESWNVLYTCGPTPMLKAIQEKVGDKKEAYMSLEQRMGCGVGACLACVCYPKGHKEWNKSYQKICCDGPVFKLQEVSLEEGY